MDHHGCLFLDATWKDMLKAFWYTTQEGDRVKTMQEVEELFGGLDKCLACFSVRSALDLFFSVMQFPKGSEVLMTAINIPDMVYIVEHHGLTVVPVDIDLGKLCPQYEEMKRLVTPRTVAILSAHIYGRWTNMDDILKIAQEHNLLVLEDCAESFSGLSEQGHPRSDLAFFSFGAIKYAAAMGGAIVKVRDAKVLEKMRAKLLTYPIFSESDYVERLLRYSIVMFLVNNPLVTKVGVRFMHCFGIDYKETIVSLLRGFPGNIIKKVRHQPSTSMLRMMLHKLQQFDEKEHAQAKINGDFVFHTLFQDILIPGCSADKMNYWLFPILVDNPVEWVKELEKERIEAYNGVTQLNLVKPKFYKQNHSPGEETTEADASRESTEADASKESTEADASRESTEADASQETTEADASQETTEADASQETTEADGSSNHEHKTDTNCSSFGCINHSNTNLYPHKAKFLIDHVLYLPVHKRVPLEDLEYLCQGVLKVAQRRHSGVARSKECLLEEFKKLAKL